MPSSVINANSNERRGAREGNRESSGEQRCLNGFDCHVTDGHHHAFEKSSCTWGIYGKTVSYVESRKMVQMNLFPGQE